MTILKARILKSIITWSEMGKQTAQAKEVYSLYTLVSSANILSVEEMLDDISVTWIRNKIAAIISVPLERISCSPVSNRILNNHISDAQFLWNEIALKLS